jgi:hypothetical protein
MKRAGRLMPQIAEMDNLYLAYWKAKRGKGGKAEVLRFGQSLAESLARLQAELLSGQVQVGDYHYFTIYDPKERLICASSFRERVLQHALMNVCHPVFERYQIYDSYACRLGKGTYAALDRAVAFSVRYQYFAKLDVRKYFETIDQPLLLAALGRLFKDRPLMDIFGQIIGSYANLPGKGLPIGNLSSQYFANHFLALADHFVKDNLGCKAYLRYMDDMVLWGHDLGQLKQTVGAFEAFLANHLLCALKPTVLNSVGQGLPFLGYVIHPHRVSLAKRSRTRFARKLRALERRLAAGQLAQAGYQCRVLPLLAFVQKADTFWFRKSVISGLENGHRR